MRVPRPPRWLIGCLVILWLFMAITTIAALRPPVVRIDQELAAQIHPGMTRAEVQSLIGQPPGWYDGITQVESDAPLLKSTSGWVDSVGYLQVTEDSWGSGTVVYWHPVRSYSRKLRSLALGTIVRSSRGQP